MELTKHAATILGGWVIAEGYLAWRAALLGHVLRARAPMPDSGTDSVRALRTERPLRAHRGRMTLAS
jgi:hypothetical protein